MNQYNRRRLFDGIKNENIIKVCRVDDFMDFPNDFRL